MDRITVISLAGIFLIGLIFITNFVKKKNWKLDFKNISNVWSLIATGQRRDACRWIDRWYVHARNPPLHTHTYYM